MRRLWSGLWALALVLTLCVSPPALAAFPDVHAGAWYAPVVEEMTAQGILKGLPDGNFHPEETISAAELVTIAARCVGLEPLRGRCDHWAADTMEAITGKQHKGDRLCAVSRRLNRQLSLTLI